MTSPSNLIERANTLMQRKRMFIAGATLAHTEQRMDDEDIPVLTEIVDVQTVSGDAPKAAILSTRASHIDAVALEFSRQLQQRFNAELPCLIDTATNRLAVEIRQAVHRIAEQALDEFIAERRQLPLPLTSQDYDGESNATAITPTPTPT